MFNFSYPYLFSVGFGVCRVLVCRLDDVLLSQDVYGYDYSLLMVWCQGYPMV